MEDKTNESNNDRKPVVGIMHVILTQAYAVFFFAVILGVVFDIMFPLHLFNSALYEYVGLIMMLVGTLVIYWAQSSTRSKKSEIGKERDANFFFHGPYKYTRNPSNFALTLMALGLGLLINSLFSIIFIIIAYLISRFIFIKKQDKILEERYGNVYNDYHKMVRDWI